ncbi:MAG: hypothetical protein JW797_17785 [Bradymonadales bacterium]|nr:hypothetical protein [Bradymonadales bacterium]
MAQPTSSSPPSPSHPENASFSPVDPELLLLPRRPPILQLLLLLAVMAFTGFIAFTYRLELAYFFAPRLPVEMGAIEQLAAPLAQNPDLLLAHGSNVYAHLSGIPQRRAITTSYQYHQLVGATVFTQEPRQDGGPMWRDIRLRTPAIQSRRERTYLDATGRLLRFEDLQSRHRGFIDFYQNGYNIHFCSHPLSSTQLHYLRHLKEELRDQLQSQLGQPPTDTQLEDAVAQQFPCQHGFLFQVGKKPEDNLPYVFLFAFLALIELAGVVLVARWIQLTWKPSRS